MFLVMVPGVELKDLEVIPESLMIHIGELKLDRKILGTGGQWLK